MNQTNTLSRVATLAALAILGATPAIAGSGGKVISATPAPPVECLTYDFFDVQYIYTAFDHLDDGHGVGANLSKSLGGNVYATVSGAWTTTGTEDFDADLYGASAGLGYFIPLSERFHLNFEAGGLYGGSDGFGEHDDDSWGFFAGPGFRYCWGSGLELFSNAYYTREEDGHDKWEFNAGFIADITETVAFKIAGLLNEDDQSVLAGLRFYY